MPALSISQGSFSCFSRDREDGSQKNMDVFSEDFIAVPSIEALCVGIPELNRIVQVADDDCFGREVEQFCACAELFLTLLQLFCASRNSLFKLIVEHFEHPRFSMQLDEDADLGTQDFGDDGDRDVVDCTASIALNLV